MGFTNQFTSHLRITGAIGGPRVGARRATSRPLRRKWTSECGALGAFMSPIFFAGACENKRKIRASWPLVGKRGVELFRSEVRELSGMSPALFPEPADKGVLYSTYKQKGVPKAVPDSPKVREPHFLWSGLPERVLIWTPKSGSAPSSIVDGLYATERSAGPPSEIPAAVRRLFCNSMTDSMVMLLPSSSW